MSVPSRLDGFEVAAAVERMLDQPDLWWQAVGLFVEHFAAWDQAWQACVGDHVREQKSVHALRSASANVGAMALSLAAAALEEQLLRCQAGQASAVPEALRENLQASFRHAWFSAAEAWNSGMPNSGEASC